MPRSRTITYAALNIAARPHPDGVYARILNRAARIQGPAHGSDVAKITRPTQSGIDGVAMGRILVWTDLDLKGRWIDIDNEEELSEEDRSEINIPAKARPNFRAFSYAFHVAKHRLYFETRNEFGETFGPKTGERLLKGVIAHFAGSNDFPDITVTLVPRKGEVERILKLEGLRRLEIDLMVPNPDHDDPEKRRRLYEKLEKMKAKNWNQTLVKAAGEKRLEPTEDIIDAAEVAAENGTVKGWGKENGRNVELSTSNSPRVEKAKLDDGENFAQRIMASQGFF